MWSYCFSKGHNLSSPFSTYDLRHKNHSIGSPKWRRKTNKFVVATCNPLPSTRTRILVAGGGIGGLAFAIAAKNKGFEVTVLEKDSSAVRGEGTYRGPIQLESNALSALEAIDSEVAAQVMDAGLITGNRVNGLLDGLSGRWFAKYDTFTPAVEWGQPVARVINRMPLQEILVRALGADVILTNSNVVNFVDSGNKVTVMLENGGQLEGDILVGADGIWSKVRQILLGPVEASYSGYTCYTAITEYVPPDIESVGIRAFLGHKKYFASCEAGAGKMQWYAFHYEPAGGTDSKNGKKKRLLELFGDWCYYVVDSINATNEEVILRRDIFDHVPTMIWGKGRVTLLGDAIHAIQPNIGQSGGMAIEDGYQLALELERASAESSKYGAPIDIISSLKRYEEQRRIRVAVMHGIARMNSIMSSLYLPYLEFGTDSLLTSIMRLGWDCSSSFIKVAMPPLLNWIVTGNSIRCLEGRRPSCRLSDKASDKFKSWFEDDHALEETINGEWYLFPISTGGNNSIATPIHLSKDEEMQILIENWSQVCNMVFSVTLPSPEVRQKLAKIICMRNHFYLTKLRHDAAIWVTNADGRKYQILLNYPTRLRSSHLIEFGSDKKAIFQVKVMRAPLQ